MYTESDYLKELEFDEWIEKHDPFKILEIDAFWKKKPGDFYREDIFKNREKEVFVEENSYEPPGMITVACEPDPVDSFEIKGINIPFLKRSYFDPRKLKTTLKTEKIYDKDDDYSILFMSLWTQLEYEYKERFYKSFIPDNKGVIFNILEETSQSKYNYFEDAVNHNNKPTFGLINVVLYAIEKAMKYGNKKVMSLLSEILGTSYGSFFKKFSLYKKLNPICNEVRNRSIHENQFISFDKYNAICMELFGHYRINDWCNSERANLFSEYLKILPKSFEENEIEGLEKTIHLAKLQGRELSENSESHENIVLRLNQMKEGLNRM